MAAQLTDAERDAVLAYLDAGDVTEPYRHALQRAKDRLRGGQPLPPSLLTLAAEAGVTSHDQRPRGIAAVAAVRYALAHPYPDTVTVGVVTAIERGPWIEARMVEVIADELRMALPDQPDTTAPHWSRLLTWCDERLGREQLDHEDATRGPRRRRQEVPA